MRASSKLFGVEAAIKRIESHKGRTLAAVDRRMGDMAETIKERSLMYCPIETGALRSTAAVSRSEAGGGLGVTWSISYGGPGVDYAAAVHFIVSAYHAPPTGAFYLERAAKEVAGEFNTRGLRITDVGVT